VLLARLHREAVGRLAVAVDRDADHAAGHVALEGVLGSEVGRVRAAEAERHAEALRAADRQVGAEFAGGVSSVSASRSAATATSAFAAWNLATTP
jgi:hypothetical protein